MKSLILEFENIGNIGTFGDNLNENSLLNQYTPIEPLQTMNI